MGPVSDATQNATSYIWYVASAKGGANTVTLTPSGGAASLEIHVSEWSGENGGRHDFTLKRAEWSVAHVTIGLFKRR